MTPSLRDAQVAKLIKENEKMLVALRAAWQSRSEAEWRKVAPLTHELILEIFAQAEEQGE